MRTAKWLSGLLLAGAAGCAGSTPPPELVAARHNYVIASRSPTMAHAPEAVYEAKKALIAAEDAWAQDDGSPVARDLAYVADRKAQLAIAQAGAQVARLEQAEAAAQAEAIAAQTQGRTKEELAMTKEQLAAQQAQMTARERELQAERAAREAAERRADQALEALKGLGEVRRDERGAVLTLPGAVLFQFGKATLMPIAQDRLSQVADVLKQQEGMKIVIEGYTDSVGSDATNDRLSLKRAESVRDFLVARGVPSGAIETLGRGETNPVADNTTPEGRANNRRVEIILRPAGGLPQGAPKPEEPGGSKPEEENPYK